MSEGAYPLSGVLERAGTEVALRAGRCLALYRSPKLKWLTGKRPGDADAAVTLPSDKSGSRSEGDDAEGAATATAGAEGAATVKRWLLSPRGRVMIWFDRPLVFELLCQQVRSRGEQYGSAALPGGDDTRQSIGVAAQYPDEQVGAARQGAANDDTVMSAVRLRVVAEHAALLLGAVGYDATAIPVWQQPPIADRTAGTAAGDHVTAVDDHACSPTLWVRATGSQSAQRQEVPLRSGSGDVTLTVGAVVVPALPARQQPQPRGFLGAVQDYFATLAADRGGGGGGGGDRAAAPPDAATGAPPGAASVSASLSTPALPTAGSSLFGLGVSPVVDAYVRFALLAPKPSTKVTLRAPSIDSGGGGDGGDVGNGGAGGGSHSHRDESAGANGPFVLYSLARIEALLERHREAAVLPSPATDAAGAGLEVDMGLVDFALLKDGQEWELAMQMVQFPAVVQLAAGRDTAAPGGQPAAERQTSCPTAKTHRVVDFLARLCRTFSRYYSRTRVLHPQLRKYGRLLPQGLGSAMDRLGPYRGPRRPIAPPR